MKKYMMIFCVVVFTASTCLAYAWSQQTTEMPTSSGRLPVGPRMATPIAGAAEPQFLGTVIHPHPAVKGIEYDAQNRIAKELSGLDTARFGIARKSNQPDPHYAQRLQHFAWCDQRTDIKFVGWRGVIQEARGSANGWTVRVRITPQLVTSAGTVASTPDYLVETYAKVGGQVQLMDVSAPVDAHPNCVLNY